MGSTENAAGRGSDRYPRTDGWPSGASAAPFSEATYFARRLGAWRRALAVGALLVAIQIPVELHYPGWPRSLPLRLGWAALLLLAILLVRPDRPRLARSSAYVVALVSGILVAGIIAITGGVDGPRFGFLLALPLVIAVLAPDVPWAAGAMGCATLAGGVVIAWLGGADGWFLGEWTMLSLTCTGLAVVGASASRKLQLKEVRARSEHAATLLRLAQVERAAAVGRLAAEVAHDVSNPLAALKANVRFVSENVDRASLDPEVAGALADILISVDRVAATLGELRLQASPD